MSETPEMTIDKALKIDVETVLPRDLWPAAELAAIEENPDNLVPPPEPGVPLELAVQSCKKWANGRTLHISFMNGDPAVQQRVKETALEWTKYANLNFDFGDHPDPEIRVSFDPPGSWSYIGTDALVIAKDKATINFGWLTPDTPMEEYQRVVLHEFGHAIGCVHEHQTDIAEIPWNVDAVYDYYINKLNWQKADVDHNIFYVYKLGMTNHSHEFDSTSIMVYPIPQAFTIGDFEIPWNRGLSAEDKRFIAQVYPGRATS